MSDPRERGIGRNYEGVGNFYSRFPQLVRQAVTAREPKQRTRAEGQLFAAIKEDELGNGVLIAFGEAQQLLLSPQVRAIDSARGFIDKLSSEARVLHEERKSLFFVCDKSLATAAVNIAKNELRIRQNSHLVNRVYTSGYTQLLGFARAIVATVSAERESIEIPYVADTVTPDESAALARDTNNLNAWRRYMNGLFAVAGPYLPADALDDFIENLRSEPEMELFQKERIYPRTFAGLSLAALEKVPYPLDTTLDAITAHLTEALSLDLHNPSDRVYIEGLFLSQIELSTDNGEPISYRNRNLLLHVNAWQDHLIRSLFSLEEDPEQDRQLSAFLNRLDNEALTQLLDLIIDRLVFPHRTHARDVEVHAAHYSLHNAAINLFAEQQGEERNAPYYNAEALFPFFFDMVLPLLQHRIAQLGLGERFREHFLPPKKMPSLEEYLRGVGRDQSRFFTEHCGEGFLERLNEKAPAIREVWQAEWRATNLTYLPLHIGSEVIPFSDRRLPALLGLTSIELTTIGSQPNWEVGVTFHMPENKLIFGKLTNDGGLHLRAPLDEGMEGLETMLNLVAVAAFRDIVIRDVYETKTGKRQGVRTGTASDGVEHRVSAVGRASQPLPRRVRQDTQLIRQVYETYGEKVPHPVSLHPMWLAGGQDYKAAIDLFLETQEREEATEEERVWAASQLKVSREVSKKASTKKANTYPKKLDRVHVVDPQTTEEFDLRTWVKDHLSPKPTTEEWQSPVRLWRNRFERGSSVAYLDVLLIQLIED